jgi:type II secretory pathway component PulF
MLTRLVLVPAFEELYVSFGANNPAPTKLLLQSRNWLWLASVVAIGIWLFWWLSTSRYQFRNRITAGFISLGAASLGILVFALWALYLPITQLAAG